MDDAALRRTMRRCTAVLVAVFAPALGAISNYDYNGRPAMLLAVAYLIVSLVVQFVDVDPDAIESADGGAGGGDASETGAGGTDADD